MATLSLPSPARIALIKPSALGDIVHALPVLSGLRALFPRAHIAWVVNRAYADLLAGHPDLDEVLVFDRGAARAGWRAALAAAWRFQGQLRRAGFDLVLDLQGLLRSGLMTLATRAPRRLGFANAREGAGWFYTHRVSVPDPEVHAVDRYWHFMAALGGGDLPKRFVLPRDQSAEAWAAGRLRDWPRPWVAFNLGTRWETKRWPVAHFAKLAQRVEHDHGGTAILVGGPDERALGSEFLRQQPAGVLNLLGQTSLTQLAALLRNVDVMVSNDSGPLHLADALGRPVLAPYTCSSPRLTGPYHQPGGAVATEVWCAASLVKSCKRMECMAELTPARLLPRLEALLAAARLRSA
ncbi:MAG TPA: glycosyltransferase family 9 protein [Gemmatales bacterium]|nr:glycosyltransferase family 9 protein [Gemmatales bacterium]HMP60558.1 glycosyltransferase family 9 protein [Gemmatales bacterium]